MARNVLILMADEHARGATGAYGNPLISTPNIDQLARSGTVFGNAYSNSPICVPARASMATGRYPHSIGVWDNNTPYTGASAASWGHRLTDHGMRVVTIGKLHYGDSADPTGFPDQRVAMHVHEKEGNPIALLRGARPPIASGRDFILEAGPGESEYHRFDLDVAENAVRWFNQEAHRDQPWALLVSFVSPHFPLVAPARHFARYAQMDLPLPTQHDQANWPRHPELDFHRRSQGNHIPVDDESIRRATRAYYGLVSFVDEQIGRILDAAAAAGHLDDTLVIYTSDHGEMLGAHGMWKKSSMYEESAAVPLIMSGPGVRTAATSETNVSLVDVFPTVLDASGTPTTKADRSLPGTSLLQIADRPFADRDVFAEYHSGWSRNAIYMLRDARYKYVHYTFDRPQLFDLIEDPGETTDLCESGEHPQAARLRARLHAIVDPVAVDAEAKSSQAAIIQRAGGRDALVARGDAFTFTPAPQKYRPAQQRVNTADHAASDAAHPRVRSAPKRQGSTDIDEG
ncbi:sulfatase-like hydrolase/transferase [Pseudonocardia sp.]|uniref:sulfatase-like hydrolase/transferase n=1 Tax=Pseudonocardia sp. TaxID=60912 RepID=UPI0031FBB19C